MSEVAMEQANKAVEIDSSFAMAVGIAKGEWPHSMDAQVWAKKWLETIQENPAIPHDEGCMHGWFANAIMAGFDQASFRFTTERAAWRQRESELCEVLSSVRFRMLNGGELSGGDKIMLEVIEGVLEK